MSERKDIYVKAYMVYIGFVILMFVVLFKTVSIQLEGRSNVFAGSDEKMPVRTVKRMPRRGEILDVHGTPLVTSVSFYDIHMDPTVIDKKIFDAEITDLSRELANMYSDRNQREYENYIRKGRDQGKRYLLIRKKVTNEERKKLKELPIFKYGRLKGGLIDTDEKIERKRPHNELMRRTLGYYREENGDTLKVGIEGAFNEYLSGEPGEEVEQRISTGWKKTGQIVKEAVEGADVVTSIDKDIQEVADAELKRQLESQGAKNGCVIVMDVKTGFVKAISNLTKGSDGNYYELYNHAIGTKEVPGSTFKLASLMAALEDGRIKITDTVNAIGTYKFRGGTMHDALEWGYGRITIKRAFEKSSNVIAKVIYDAYRNDPQAYIDRLVSFGLDQKLGIDLEGEADPVLYRPGTPNWSKISLPWMSVGYEFQQTPLQTLAFYNAVANNGTLVKPQFVQEIRRSGQTIKTFAPIVLKDNICSDNTLTILKSCLEGVMKDGGTGSKLTSAQFKIAGKTGTARILNEDQKYGQKGEWKYQASFVGYFPAEDPIYSCIVVVAAPSKDIYGATVSGTVFTAIANKVFATTLKYHKAVNEGKRKKENVPSVFVGNSYDLTKALGRLRIPYAIAEEGEWLYAERKKHGIVFKKRNPVKEIVPNLTGMSAKDAVFLIESMGMSAYVIGYGKVTKQSIPPGASLFKGGIIELTLE